MRETIYFMWREKTVAKIIFDYKTKTVSVENYTDKMQLRPFGINETPSFDDFEYFLESRCMPKTRHDLKFILKELDLPCWDPWVLIRFNHGLQYEDYGWIRMEGEEVNYEDIKIRN